MTFLRILFFLDKLPNNFLSLPDFEKNRILFGNDLIKLEDFDDVNNSKVGLFNFEKIKELNKLYNIQISPEDNIISFELNLLCECNESYCYPFIELDYNTFEIKNFDSGL